MRPLRKAWVGMLVWLLISGMWLHRAPAMTQAAPPLANADNRLQTRSSNTQRTEALANPLITGSWQPGFNDLSFSDGVITSVTTDSAGNWYFGGYFNQLNGVAVNNIARWNGTSWSALPTTQPDGSNWQSGVASMAFWGNNLYVGGTNMSIGGLTNVDLAYWDGATWRQAGSGFDQTGTVSHIAVLNNELFIHGDFQQFNGVNVIDFARWDGTNTRQVSADLSDMQFMQAAANKLYIGGKRLVNQTKVDTVAVWDGSVFQIISSGEINPLSLKVINEQLYGVKKLSASSSALMRWNGTVWVVEINNIPFIMHNFAFDNDQFYAESQQETNFALYSYTNQTWQRLNCSCSGKHSVYLVNNRLFITSTRNKPLMSYFNNQWQEFVVKSTKAADAAVTAYQDDVYIASTQSRLINNVYVESRTIKSWENNTWKVIYQVEPYAKFADMQAAEDGVYFMIHTPHLSTYELYFYKKSLNSVRSIRQFEFETVHTLFRFEPNTLYVVTGNVVYAWNGSTGQSIGLPQSGFAQNWIEPFAYNQQLHLLMHYGSSPDQRPLLRIFRRNGWEWVDQNVVIEGYPSASATNANGVYFAGQFYHNNQVYHLVRWDGSQFEFIDTPGAVIDTVAAEGTDLYVGGMFDRLPGCICYNVGYWNGNTWQPVGSGTNGRIRTMSLAGDRLYLTGWFSQTGNQAAVEFGLWFKNDVDIPRSYLPSVSR